MIRDITPSIPSPLPFVEVTGSEIFYRQWTAETAKAAVIIIHGLGEHSGRYVDLGEYLASSGYDVYAIDLRGHGRSAGRRGCIGRFEDFVMDLEKLLCKIGDERIFLLGHSLGSLITIEYVLKHEVSGFIISGLTLGGGRALGFLGSVPVLNSIPIPLGEILTFFLGKRAIRSLCSNEMALDKYLKDDLAHGKITLKLLGELSEESERIREGANSIVSPVLVLIGEEDHMGNVEDAKWFYDNVSSDKKDIIVYRGMKHNIFDEVDREEVFSDVLRWLEENKG